MVDMTTADPELRGAGRLLPRGYALHRGLAVPRAVMNLAGWMGRSSTSADLRQPTAAVDDEDRAGDVRRGVAGQKEHGIGDLGCTTGPL